MFFGQRPFSAEAYEPEPGPTRTVRITVDTPKCPDRERISILLLGGDYFTPADNLVNQPIVFVLPSTQSRGLVVLAREIPIEAFNEADPPCYGGEEGVQSVWKPVLQSQFVDFSLSSDWRWNLASNELTPVGGIARVASNTPILVIGGVLALSLLKSKMAR